MKYIGSKRRITGEILPIMLDEKFYEWCEVTVTKGHKVFVSEYQMPSEFKCVWVKGLTNSMHQTKTKRVTERLFTLE